MKTYLILVRGSFAAWNLLPEARRNEAVARFGEFARELGKSGHLKGGDGCGERSFRFSAADVSDGLVNPETKDMVTGYFQIEVSSEDEAIALARKCPAFECGEHVELVPCGH